MTDQEKTAAVQSVVEASIRGEQPLSVGWLVKENADLRELNRGLVQRLERLEKRMDAASKAFAELKREVAAGSGVSGDNS